MAVHSHSRRTLLALACVVLATLMLTFGIAPVELNLTEVAAQPAVADPVRLNGDLALDADIERFTVSADSSRVVYLDTSPHDLYSVPIAGGLQTRLGSLREHSMWERFTVSPDSSQVVYIDSETGDLHSVPIDGGTPIKLETREGLDPRFMVTPDSARVVYTIGYFLDPDSGSAELYSVPIDGGTPVKLNGPLPSGGHVSGATVSPDSARVVYRADQDIDDVHELYSVPIGGGTPVKLNGPLPSGGNVLFGGVVSPDSTHVVYRVYVEAAVFTDDVYELYSVPIDGGTPVKLTATLPTGRNVDRFAVSPDSTQVVYWADQDTDDVYELYSVPIDGGTPVKLNATLTPGGFVALFAITPNSTRVVYWAIQDTDDVYELYSVPIDGGTPVKLNAPLTPGGDVGSHTWFHVPVTDVFTMSPDGAAVIYRADQDTDQTFELYSVPIAGGTPVKLNGPLPSDGGVLGGFVVSPDSANVVYLADQDTDDVNELYSARLANRPPLISDASFSVAEDAAVGRLVGVVTATDPDGDTLTFALTGGNSGGAFALDSATGELTVAGRLDHETRTSYTLTVTATDDWPEPQSASAVVTVEVTDIGEATSVGLVDPSQGKWYLRDADTAAVRSFYYGNPGDVPFLGDWNCDGIETPGLFRTSDAYAYLRNSNTVGIADVRFYFGNPDDVPLAGDFDGDGCDTLSLYRPSEQRFYIINRLGENEGGLGKADYYFTFGNPGDKPVVGDWDGDGIDEVGLHRESTGFFYYRDTLDTGIASDEFYFGDPGDRFVAGDWGIVDGVETPGCYRPADTTFFFRHTNTPGVADSQFTWGETGWLPVSGTIN